MLISMVYIGFFSFFNFQFSIFVFLFSFFIFPFNFFSVFDV